MAVVLTIFLLVISAVGTNTRHIGDYADLESIFRMRLLQNYDPHVLPRRSDKTPINCTVNFYPMRLLKADFDQGEIKMILWLDITWNDYRLSWDTNSSFGVQKITIPNEEIWHPDIVLLNGLTELITHDGSVGLAMVYPTGDVSYVPAMKILAYCNAKGTKPSDNGELHWMLCDLKFSSWMHNGLDYNIFPGSTIHDTSYPMTMTKTSVKISKLRPDVEYFDCCPGPFPSVILPIYLSHIHGEDKK